MEPCVVINRQGLPVTPNATTSRSGPRPVAIGDDGDASDFHDCLGRPQFRDADWCPGWVGPLEELGGDAEQKVSVTAQAHVVRVDLNDVRPARSRLGERRGDVAKCTPQLLLGVVGKQVVGRLSCVAGHSQRVTCPHRGRDVRLLVEVGPVGRDNGLSSSG